MSYAMKKFAENEACDSWGMNEKECKVYLKAKSENKEDLIESTLEAAKEIVRLTGSRSRIVFNPLPQNDPKVRQPDITKAKRILRWEPRVSREEGLRRTLQYFKGRISASQR
jgi:Na+/phosphate symporter